MLHSPIVTMSLNNSSNMQMYQDALAAACLNAPLPFVEILWDNYCHMPPRHLAGLLEPFADRVALHVMYSRFLELEPDDLARYFAHLRQHVDVLDPLYVSDHICRFSEGYTKLLTPVEWSYERLDETCHRVEAYQNALGRPLLVENYASTDSCGHGQVEFFTNLRQQTGCEVLFDISNAVVSELNGVTPVSDWWSVLEGGSVRCHVGSYSRNPNTDRLHDMHNADVSQATLDAIRQVSAHCDVASLCYERDYNVSAAVLANDLRGIRGALDRRAA